MIFQRNDKQKSNKYFLMDNFFKNPFLKFSLVVFQDLGIIWVSEVIEDRRDINWWYFDTILWYQNFIDYKSTFLQNKYLSIFLFYAIKNIQKSLADYIVTENTRRDYSIVWKINEYE